MQFSRSHTSNPAQAEQEDHQAFRIRVLTYFMGVAIVFGFLIGILGELGIMVIGVIQSRTDFLYALFNLVLLFWLRRDKVHFKTIAWIQVLSSFVTFLVALLVVPNDEFRIIWFYVAVYIAYILLGIRAGIGITVASIFTVIAAHALIDLHLSDTAIYTAILGLIVASLLTRAYSSQIVNYESRLMSKNRELEANVRELDQALERAHEASHTKSMFLAKMSHEIRTPMNGVLSMVQVMKTTRLDEQQQIFLSSIERSGKTLLTLINDLLDISRVESGRLALSPLPFRVWFFIEDILTQIEPMFEYSQASYRVDICNELPEYLVGDEVRLKQVIVNLVSNAAKFTHGGEVILRIHGSKLDADTFDLHVEVQDSGIGIPADKLETIFEPFRQLSPTRVANRGAGLGLSISKTIVESMHGSMQVESQVGVGSCFTIDVRLPIATQDEMEFSTKELEFPQESLRILLADDDPVSRLAVQTLLGKPGHEVVVVENGAEALQRLETELFDVILMDVHMPVLDGVSATRQIKSRHLTLAPVIGMTASVMNIERAGYILAGMDALVEKPVNYHYLLQVIYNKLHRQ